MRFEDDLEVSSWRQDPGQAHGPKRWKLILIGGGLVAGIALFCLLPFGGWFDAITARWSAPAPKASLVASVSVDKRLFNGLAEHHRSEPLPSPAPPPTHPPLAAVTETKPVESKPLPYDALMKRIDELSDQVSSLLGQGTKPESKSPETTPKAKTVDAAQQKRLEEAKRRREAMLKSPRTLLTRPKEDKPGMLHALQSPFSLAPSEEIPCETTMAISSDTPGAFVAVVSRDVPDTATRQKNVIPKGSKFVLKPRRKTIMGDSRIDVQAQTLTFPSGPWLKLPAATVTDRAGTAGFTGDIDRHLLRNYGAVILTGVLRGGTTIVAGGYGGSPAERVTGAVAQDAAAEATRDTRQFIRTDPTITVPALYTCRLLLEEELVLTRSYPWTPSSAASSR